MERDGDEVHCVALAPLCVADPDHPLGGDEEGSRGLRRARAEGNGGVAVRADELFPSCGVEAGNAVVGDVGAEVEPEHHGLGFGRGRRGEAKAHLGFGLSMACKKKLTGYR